MTLRSPTCLARAAVALIAPLVLSCGGSSADPTDPLDPGPGPWAFTALPIALDAILWITPLGSINPPARPVPTDHIYLSVTTGVPTPAAARTAFFAPASGIVRDVFSNSMLPDVGLDIRVTSTTYYRIGHMIPEIPLARGTRVTAGQRLGTTGSVLAIDLGVYNDSVRLGFVNPDRPGHTENTDKWLKYFIEPLRSQLYAKVQRIGPERDGRIDYDIPGRLSGNWFTADSIPLVFIYEPYDPARILIGVSGGLLRTGSFSITTGDPLPRDVSVATGLVRYTLTAGRPGGPIPIPTAPTARMLVQMLDDQRIRVEMFDVSASANVFTANAKVFVR